MDRDFNEGNNINDTLTMKRRNNSKTKHAENVNNNQ